MEAAGGHEELALPRGGGWHRLLAIIAALWAIPVLIYTCGAIGLDTEADITRRWVVAKLYLVEEFYGRGSRGESAADKRERLYGNASDEEIIHSTDPPLGERDRALRVPIERIRLIEREYEGQLWMLEHWPRVAAVGLLCWLAPLAALFLLGNAAAAMYAYANALVDRRGMLLDAAERRTPASAVARLLVRGSLIAVAGFYLANAVGWAFSSYAVGSGMLGKMNPRFEAAWQSLSALDHAVRLVQVVLISIASGLLVLGKRAALPLMLVTILFATFSTFAMPQWNISFLSGAAVEILMLVAGYLYWLDRRGLLR